ncbi:MAG: tetratricopeptide repeat protein [Hyphomicrobiaceae bacterium]
MPPAATGLRRSLCVGVGAQLLLWLAASAAGAQQQAPAAALDARAAACFTETSPEALVAACNIALGSNRAALTGDQVGLAFHRRAGASTALGRVDAAIADFRSMVGTGYRAHEAQASIGSLEFARQRLNEAETAYREAIRLSPAYGVALAGLGNTLVQLSRASEAIQYFDRAIAAEPRDAQAHLGKGIALSSTGDNAASLVSLDKAIEINPRALAALHQRARVRITLGDQARGFADADAAVSVAVGEERVRALLSRGQLRHDTKSEALAAADCTAADVEATRLGTADRLLRADVLLCLGRARQAEGALEAAGTAYDRAVSWAPDSVDSVTLRGFVAYQRGRYDDAIRDFETALRLDARAQDAMRYLGLAYSDKGDHQGAEAAFRRAFEALPQDPWPIMIRAAEAARIGDRTLALAEVERALRLLGPQSSDVLLVRGAVHYLLDDMDLASRDFEAAIRIDPANAQAHRLMARTHLRQGRVAEARAPAETALRLQPGDSAALFVSGLAALARRDLPAAIEMLSASIAANSAHAEPFAARGEAYEATGSTAAAIADYRAAITKLATDADGRRALTRARERLAALAVGGASPPQTKGSGSSAPLSLPCRLLEGVFAPSRRVTGVEFDVGCPSQN